MPRILPKWWAVRMVERRQVFVMRYLGPIRLEEMRRSKHVIAAAGPIEATGAQPARVILVRLLNDKERQRQSSSCG